MMNKLAFAVPELSYSQRGFYCIQEANRIAERNLASPTVFFESVSVSCPRMHLFPMMQFAESWGYDGTMVATSLSTIQKTMNLPCLSRRVFYVWDLEWTRLASSFESFASVYANRSIELVARSESHAKLLEQAWNRPVLAVIDNFKGICEKLFANR